VVSALHHVSHWESVKDLTFSLRNHLLAFVLALFALTFLFLSLRSFLIIIFFFVVLLYAAHELHFNRHIYETYEIIGIFSVFFLLLVFLFYALFELLALALIVVYLVALVSSIYIYFHHHGSEHMVKVFVASLYSHILAAAVSLWVGAGLAFLFTPSSFVNFWYILGLFILPVSFVYFFCTMFFYLYFFDRKHIRLDLKRGAVHAVVFSAALIVLLVLCFLGFSWFVFSSEKTAMIDQVDASIADIDAVFSSVSAARAGGDMFPDTVIAQDISGALSSYRDGLVSLKSSVSASHFSVLGFLKDDTFTSLIPLAAGVDSGVVYSQSMVDAYYDASNSYAAMVAVFSKDNETLFSEQLNRRLELQKDWLDDVYISRSPSQTVVFLEGKAGLVDPDFDEQFGDGALDGFAYLNGAWFLSSDTWPSPDSIFVRAISGLLMHTVEFRYAVLRAASPSLVSLHESEYSPTLEFLISGRDHLETPRSESVRLDLILQRTAAVQTE
jgi:hypothetical protein